MASACSIQFRSVCGSPVRSFERLDLPDDECAVTIGQGQRLKLEFANRPAATSSSRERRAAALGLDRYTSREPRGFAGRRPQLGDQIARRHAVPPWVRVFTPSLKPTSILFVSRTRTTHPMPKVG